MNLSDYLIDQEGYDWAGILADWAWLLPSDLTVWMVNRFGDLIFVPDDGTVQFLDIGAGSVKQVAESREDFFTQVDLGDNADSWLLISLTDKCVSTGLVLGPGQCYTFKIAPVFDGKYSIDNIEIGDLVVNYSLLAQTHQQIKDLPDGAQIKLVLGA
ncbi:protein of unknown function [Pseudoxanthomonas sp. CF385]|uniref:T6SS immunity protein Tdi1 domain-containing protein n=1 Tax=Pseudoxanthomonas sp. CF385 TaxID=1881042 RepID=UPI00088C4E36|nr:T6SS immunity protein Tdi1 domain-containing protein [Pseudoxanthomonas sp. CF385]SDR20698.1 protein of unknown function [Pseudoxanthomonas sp. CF385]